MHFDFINNIQNLKQRSKVIIIERFDDLGITFFKISKIQMFRHLKKKVLEDKLLLIFFFPTWSQIFCYIWIFPHPSFKITVDAYKHFFTTWCPEFVDSAFFKGLITGSGNFIFNCKRISHNPKNNHIMQGVCTLSNGIW